MTESAGARPTTVRIAPHLRRLIDEERKKHGGSVNSILNKLIADHYQVPVMGEEETEGDPTRKPD